MYATAKIYAHKDEIKLFDATTGNLLDILECEGLGNMEYNAVVGMCLDLAKANNRDLAAYQIA